MMSGRESAPFVTTSIVSMDADVKVNPVCGISPKTPLTLVSDS